MKARNVCIALMAAGVLAAVSCRQDPIFFIITSETAPQKPRIEGSPTNMVVFERALPGREAVPVLYVASGRLHWYAKAEGSNTPQWDSNEYKIPQPRGRIISLAATKDRLYALCLDGHSANATLRYIEPDSDGGNVWKEIGSQAAEYPFIQSVYADPETGQLFAGARRNSKDRATYSILYLDSDDTLKMLKAETAIFSGAVYRNGVYYLCTRGSGIFRINEADLVVGANESTLQLADITNIDDKNNDQTIISMIKLKDEAATIIAVTRREGYLYKVSEDSIERMYNNTTKEWISTGWYATGALSLWEGGDYKMLIAGIQGGLYSTTTSSYTYGYVEFDLNTDGSFNTDSASTRRRPPNLQSAPDNDRYTASLGKHPINHLFQVPVEIDDNKTFFASTQTAGLWSYKDRPKNGGEQWNAEE